MLISNFDELNRVGDWFSRMELTRYQLEARQDAADDFLDMMLEFYLLLDEQEGHGGIDAKAAKDTLEDEYRGRLRGRFWDLSPDFMEKYPEVFAGWIIKGVEERMEQEIPIADGKTVKSGWVNPGPAAAFWVAVNEATTACGRDDFEVAKARGFTKKRWVTVGDERVRETHVAAEGQVVPIDGYFKVGRCLMLYPHDALNGTPEEVINCRCTVHYFG